MHFPQVTKFTKKPSVKLCSPVLYDFVGYFLVFLGFV